MAELAYLSRTEAETRIDTQGVAAASALIDDLDLPTIAYPFDLDRVAQRGALLEGLVLPSDARNLLDDPEAMNRSFSWAANARRYMIAAAKLRGRANLYIAKLRILQTGHEDWQADLFADTQKDLHCSADTMPDPQVYPYDVALGKITLRREI